MITDAEQQALVENMVQELRRGVVVLAVLSELAEEQYGFLLLKQLADKGLSVDQGTLYPLLRRLEGQGLLESRWRVEEARPRRYYVISASGRAVLPKLQAEWTKIAATIQPLLKGKSGKGE